MEKENEAVKQVREIIDGLKAHVIETRRKYEAAKADLKTVLAALRPAKGGGGEKKPRKPRVKKTPPAEA